MNNNTKLIEEYEAEIADILKRISSDLSVRVIADLGPKMEDLSQRIESSSQTTVNKLAEVIDLINQVSTETKSISNKITKLENVKTLELLITETKNRQETTTKFIYSLILLNIAILVITIILLFAN